MGLGGRQWLACQDVHSESLVFLIVGVLHLDQRVLWIETGVLGECAGHDKECICEASDSQLGFSRNFLGLGELVKVFAGGDLEGTGARDDSLVLEGVLDGTEPITDGILSLRD